MKRLGLALLTTVVLVGCGGGGGSNGSPAPTPEPVPVRPTPPPRGARAWGELACQKTASCRSEVLNQPFERVVEFFVSEDAVERPIQTDPPEAQVFLCGHRWSRAWDRAFANRGDGDVNALVDLMIRVLDTSTCRPKENLQQDLKTYFENTEEYKNETS